MIVRGWQGRRQLTLLVKLRKYGVLPSLFHSEKAENQISTEGHFYGGRISVRHE